MQKKKSLKPTKAAAVTQEIDNGHMPMDIDQTNIQLNETNNQEILRIIQQYLLNQGYEEVAKQLEKQSNVHMEDEQIHQFRMKVLQGQYLPERMLESNPLQNLPLSPDQQRQVEYYLYEQEYLELMEKGRKMEAIQILQKELAPRYHPQDDKSKLHQLAQLITCTNGQVEGPNQELRNKASWKGSEEEGRKALLDKIQKLMPSNVMLQPNRMEELFKQALAFQVHNCRYHNIYQNNYSLLENHTCSKQMLPTKCIAVLTKHKDEVWAVQFSPSGKRLASMGKDNLVYLWSFTKQYDNKSTAKPSLQGSSFHQSPYRYRIKCTHEIKAHQKQMNSLSWTNLDDRWLLTSSLDKTAKIWDSKSGKLVCELGGKHSESLTAAVFSADDTQVITSATDKYIILWEIRPNTDGSDGYHAVVITTIETKCYLDIAISSNRIVAKGQKSFQVFNISDDNIREALEDVDSQYEIESDDSIFRIALSKDGRYLLANCSFEDPRLELYDLNRKEIIKKYRGHQQQLYLIKCDFGGVNESFAISGSEDGCVYLWSKEKGDIIAKLGDSPKDALDHHSKKKKQKKFGWKDHNPSNDGAVKGHGGHSQVVNAVHWCPGDTFILVSASDDQTIRIWGLEDMPNAEVIQESKEIKKIDAVSTTQNGRYNFYDEALDEDDDDEDDDFEDDEEDQDMQESSSEEEQQQANLQRESSSRRLVQIQEDDEDEESDWAEGGTM